MGRRTWMLALWATAACSDGAKTDDTADETGDPASAGRGLPEGSSTWEGTIEVGGLSFPLVLELENTGGDLEGTATYSDNPDTPLGFGSISQYVTGTHEPTGGLVALAPLDFVEPPSLELELLGATAAYDPETDMLVGMAVDWASGDENALVGGPLSVTRTSGDGEPTVTGDLGAALSEGSHTFTGTTQCTSDVREAEGTLEYDGQGGLSGTITLGDYTLDTPVGTFAITGVHNPSNGRTTLVPGLWLETDDSKLTNFVDGVYDAGSGAFTGDMRTNVNACPPATWSVIVE